MSVCAVQAVFAHSRSEASTRLVMHYIAWKAHKETDCCSVGLEEVAAACMVTDRQVRRAIRWLADHGEIAVINTGQGRGQTPTWQVTLPIEKQDTDVRFSETENRTPRSVKQDIHGKKTGRPGPVSEPTPLNKDNKDNKTTTPLPPKGGKREYTPEFERYWALVVRKEPSKSKSYEAWQKALEREADPEVIIAGAERWLPVWRATDDPTKIAHATTWLNQDRWTVEQPTMPRSPNGRPRQGVDPNNMFAMARKLREAGQ